MKHSTRWLLLIAAIGVLACNLLSNPLESPTAIPPATVTVTPTVIATATPLIAAPPTIAVPTEEPPTVGCATWFFTFRPGQSESGCPDPEVKVDAVGQDFVGGRVYRYGPTPDFTDERGTIFVIYNDGTWDTYPDTFAPGDPASDPSIKPPSNRFQPISAIGKVWRDNPAVRAALGWAYGPELPFKGRYQNPQGDSRNVYVDHGKGLVLRLMSNATGPRTWDVAGDY